MVDHITEFTPAGRIQPIDPGNFEPGGRTQQGHQVSGYSFPYFRKGCIPDDGIQLQPELVPAFWELQELILFQGRAAVHDPDKVPNQNRRNVVTLG